MSQAPTPFLRAASGVAVHAVIGPCARVREFLLEYLEHRLPLPTRLRFRLHLLLCGPCTRYLGKYRTGVALAQATLDDPPPPELVDLTLRFLHERTGATAETHKP